MDDIRQVWKSSKKYRVMVVIAVIYALLRLTVHLVYISGALIEDPIPIDLAVYIDIAEQLAQGQALYHDAATALDVFQPYLYSPTFAVIFSGLFRWFSPSVNAYIHSFLHLAAYLFLYYRWQQIFRRAGLDQVNRMLAWSLPIWLIYTFFWLDLTFLNVGIFIAVLVTLNIEAVLQQRLVPAVIWSLLLIIIKPQWAFALVLPLVLGHRRFFLKLLAATIIGYLATTGTTILIMGWEYGWAQFGDYYRLLARIGQIYPWRGPENTFLGTNHSLTQTIMYLAGTGTAIYWLAMAMKLVISLPLLWFSLKQVISGRKPASGEAIFGLELALVYYLAVYIWLDVVWQQDFFLGSVVFAYTLALMTGGRLWLRLWVGFSFILYALSDFLQLAGFIALDTDSLIEESNMTGAVTDPGSFIPLAIIVILTFYLIFVIRLFRQTGRPIAGLPLEQK